MEDNGKFETTVGSLFKGMEGFVSAKTVVGDAVTVKDTIILPLMDVTFGVAAGAGTNNAKDNRKGNAVGGMGCKMTPSAVLVIHDGMTRLVNVKNQDVVNKIVDMVPDVLEKITSIIKNKKNAPDEEVEKAVDDILNTAE